ncbi:MAG: PQQ-binding-like beta-propeller repeat protein [Terriglobia bacterium]
MPSFPDLSKDQLSALAEFLTTGKSRRLESADPATRMRYRFTGYDKFLDPQGYPAVTPPWGTLNAIDLTTGKYAWKIPFGYYPALAAEGIKNTGTENYGGPVVTAGGLLFIAATNYDRKIRAFDNSTGKLLWEAGLPFAGNATPATYEVDGRQYVVIAAGGGKRAPGAPRDAAYVAFTLPH